MVSWISLVAAELDGTLDMNRNVGVEMHDALTISSVLGEPNVGHVAVNIQSDVFIGGQLDMLHRSRPTLLHRATNN